MMDRRAFGIGLGAGLMAASQARASQSQSALKDAITPLLAGKVGPGGFAAVTRGAELTAFHSWGHASLPFRQPVTERTLFHLGSCGKQVTAMGVLQLEAEGKVDRSRPIGAYVKDLPTAWADIPISRLLSHTSGIEDYLAVLTEWDRPQPREVVLKATKDRPQLFRPGDAWSYSNTNYLLLGWLIADVSGRSYADYISDRVLKAAGAPTARPDAAGEIVEDRAEPYTDLEGRVVHSPRMETGVSAAGDGGILMSAVDVGPWRAALATDRLVGRAQMVRALVSEPLNTGRQAPYNYGFMLERMRGQTHHQHGGGTPGFICQWIALPDQGLSVLVALNYDGPGGVSPAILAYGAMEAVEPGSTFLSLSANREDARSRALKALLSRGDTRPDPAVLAPELAVLGEGPRGVPKARQAITSIVPVESYEANGGEMVRYRVTQASGISHRLAGWTRDNKLFWL